MSQLNWAAVATLPTDVILSQSGLYKDYQTHLGVTVDGIQFNPNTERQSIQYDGKLATHIEQLHYDTGSGPIIQCTLLQFVNRLNVFEPGITSASGSGNVTTVYTPKKSGELYAASDYFSNFCWVMPKQSGGFARYRFPKAICLEYSVQSRDKEVMKISAQFAACLDLATAASAPGTKPYVIELLSAFS